MEVTPRALQRIQQERQQEASPDARLRIRVTGQAGPRATFEMGWDARLPGPGDRTFDTGGVPWVTDSRSSLFLSGIVLDYVEGIRGRGFVFRKREAEQE